MLEQIDIGNILFLDIETVPGVYQFSELDEEFQGLWSDKMRFLQQREEKTAEQLYERAGIYAEFGKVICISTALIHRNGGAEKLRVKSFYGHDEAQVLRSFAQVLNRYFSGTEKYLCGHNIKEFDVPFIARRMLLNGIELPKTINLPGKKPWEVNHLDTMELWKFGDYKHFTSLHLLARLFGIPTPKDDISGADVGRVYYEENNLERIKVYCEKDTVTVANVFRKFKNLLPIAEQDVEYV
jgi:3'-5' exonuclease